MADILGIDVSYYNGTIDWAKVKAAGIKFAIIRGGYGKNAIDSQLYNNLKGAKANGIPVGIYWFSYALNAAGAKAEAQKCCTAIKGYDISLPVFFDFEYDTVRYGKENGVTLGKTAFNDHAVAFCEEVKAQGYKPGVYYNLDYLRNMVDLERLGGYVRWYAQYASKPSITEYDLWQYSSGYIISGINGKFDINVLKKTELLTGGGYNGRVGWQKDETGWWYVHEDGSYTTNAWEKIGGKWYFFNQEGYMVTSKWAVTNDNAYYLGEDGAMVTNRSLKIGSDGKLIPAGAYYYKLGEVPDVYRDTLDKLISSGVIKGREGSGEDLVLDLGEDAVRMLVYLDRAGMFGAS